MVRNPPSNAGDAGVIPGQGTKIPRAAGQLTLTLQLEKACVLQQKPSAAKRKRKPGNTGSSASGWGPGVTPLQLTPPWRTLYRVACVASTPWVREPGSQHSRQIRAQTPDGQAASLHREVSRALAA